jgi:hypothetical protein
MDDILSSLEINDLNCCSKGLKDGLNERRTAAFKLALAVFIYSRLTGTAPAS